MPAPDRTLAFLRGVNVGGKNRVHMATLRQALTAAGLTGVATHIQSGNLVFDGGHPDPAGALAQALAAQGVDVPAVLCPARRLAALRAGCPFPAEPDTGAHDPRRVHLGLFTAPPAAAARAALAEAWPARAARKSPPHDLVVLGEDHLWLATPQGMARTRLTNAWLDRQLGVTTTFRNLATVDRVLALV